jgi:hypothetical protein
LGSNFLSDNLISGNPDANIGTVGFAGLPSGQKTSHGSGVITGSIAICPCFIRGKSAKYGHLMTKWLQF